MPVAALIPAIIGAAGTVGGALLNKSKTTNQQSTSNQSSTATTTPVEAPEYTGLRDLLIKQATDKLNAPSALPAGYEEGGIGSINSTYDLIRQKNANNLVARGLSASPVAGVVDASTEMSRGGNIAGFRSNLPLIQRELANEDWQKAFSIFGARPIGSTTTGTGTINTTGSVTVPGSPLGGGLTSMAGILAYLYGRGAFGGGTPASAPDVPWDISQTGTGVPDIGG